jgi:FSR family fosmidomycin resistance protein-like MFS transporter
MGMASGLILGFTFASGSVGTLLSGVQADYFGFDAVFFTTASITLVAGLLAIPLDKLSIGKA